MLVLFKPYAFILVLCSRIFRLWAGMLHANIPDEAQIPVPQLERGLTRYILVEQFCNAMIAQVLRHLNYISFYKAWRMV